MAHRRLQYRQGSRITVHSVAIHVRTHLEHPPQARQGSRRHRRLRGELQDHQQGGLRHRAQLPDRHAWLRSGGAVVSRVHQAPRTDRPRHGRPERGARYPARNSSSIPVQAAFNIGAMIRWLDFNDTWLAAEWGHPSDNLGGILATADWLSRTAVAAGKPPLTMKDVLDRDDQGARDPGRDRAGEQLQSRRARPRRAGQGRVDRGGRGDARSVARRDHRCRVAGVGRWPEPAHLSPLAEHRIAQKLGRRRRDLARGAPGADGRPRARWAIRRCSAPRPGASTTSCSRATPSSSSAPTAATSWRTCCSRSASRRSFTRRPRSNAR